MTDLIQNFYAAFNQLDAEAMAACYHPEIEFEDPAFGVLKGEHAGNMWRMLCASQKGKDFKVEVSGITAEGERGSAHWEAWYNFGATGRRVHNQIDAEFEFRDGLIVKHTDHFDLYRWSRQAFGIAGTILGWTPLFKNKLRSQTNSMLTRFENR